MPDDQQAENDTVNVVRLGTESAPVYYTNSMNIRVSVYDFEFLISRLDISGGGVFASTLARLIMSPQHAKALNRILSTNLDNYERLFGPIRDEPIEGQQGAIPLSTSAPQPPSSRSRAARRKSTS